MPTGVALPDARARLFDAAERVLIRDGPGALTSRAVTTEAGCAKGVLHRHFADFDALLAELVADRIARIDQQAETLLRSAGTGTVAGNIAGALSAVFESVAVGVVGLIASRDELRVRLRQTTPTGIPLLTEAAAMIACYLTSEQRRGRIAADADVDAFAFTLIGAAHLLFAGRSGEPIEAEAVHKTVTTVVAGIRREPTP